jgi:hypothetical protein
MFSKVLLSILQKKFFILYGYWIHSFINVSTIVHQYVIAKYSPHQGEMFIRENNTYIN